MSLTITPMIRLERVTSAWASALGERVGYPGRRAIPVDADPDPDWLQDGLLDSVKSRAPVYRPTP
jgi:hypothetical protein